MAEYEEMRRHVEALLGHPPIGIVILDEPLALYSTESGTRRSSEYRIFPDGTIRLVKICPEASLLTIGGVNLTGSDGRVDLRLSEFHCLSISVRDPVIVVATARTNSPVFVTAVPEIIDGGSDVRIVANAWQAGGTPAANVPVAWLCRVQHLPPPLPPID